MELVKKELNGTEEEKLLLQQIQNLFLKFENSIEISIEMHKQNQKIQKEITSNHNQIISNMKLR